MSKVLKGKFVSVVKSRALPIGDRRVIAVGLEKDGSGLVSFVTPITKEDFLKNGEKKNGKILPRASAWRRKNQLITQLSLSKEALLALRDLLNELLK